MNLSLVFTAAAVFTILNCSCQQRETRIETDISDSTCNVVLQQCLTDTTQSYWLALPADIDPHESCPLIIAFDPHGNGYLAVHSLMGAVTDFGYMVAGSNVIRNGYDNIENAFTILTNDILSRFPVDFNRIYSAGFSGGGRFAQIFSQVNTDIKAVISTGAGFSLDPSRSIRNKVPMLFLVGDEDFNWLEIEKSKENLNVSGIHYYIFGFRGKHEWPERQIMDEALLWFEFDNCRRNKSRQNDPVIQNYREIIHQNASMYIAEQDMMRASKEYEKGIAMLSGLTNTGPLVKKLDFCKESQDYKDKLAKMNHALNLESRLQQGYISALNQKDTLWWRNEIIKLNQRIAEKDDPYLLSAYQRVKNFISMAAYSFCNVSLRDNDLARVRRLIYIYQIADPGNPDGYYFNALYYSRSGQFQKANEFYRKAVDSGFNDFEKAESELPGEVYAAGQSKK
jgi:predicted esterase